MIILGVVSQVDHFKAVAEEMAVKVRLLKQFSVVDGLAIILTDGSGFTIPPARLQTSSCLGLGGCLYWLYGPTTSSGNSFEKAVDHDWAALIVVNMAAVGSSIR